MSLSIAEQTSIVRMVEDTLTSIYHQAPSYLMGRISALLGTMPPQAHQTLTQELMEALPGHENARIAAAQIIQHRIEMLR